MTPSPEKNSKPRKKYELRPKKPTHTDFPGFNRYYNFDTGKFTDSGHFTIYPNILEEYWAYLTGAEQKCLDYIIRATFGYHKPWDNIGLLQLQCGYRGKKILNNGTGLSRAGARNALKGLVRKGFIKIIKQTNWVSRIELSMRKDEETLSSAQLDLDKILDCFPTKEGN